MNVVQLYDSNYRNVPATLRKIADEVEAGKYGEIGCCAIAMLGDTLEAFGCGSDCDGPEVVATFFAAMQLLSQSMVNHGR